VIDRAAAYCAADAALSVEAGRAATTATADRTSRGTLYTNSARFTSNADLATVAIRGARAVSEAATQKAARSIPTISICIACLNTAVATKQAGLAGKRQFAIPIELA
jgi:hypothetical protein